MSGCSAERGHVLGSSRVLALCPKLRTFLTHTSRHLSPEAPPPGSEAQVSSCIPHRTHLLWEGRRAHRKARWKVDEPLDIRKSSMRGAFLRAIEFPSVPCFHLRIANPPSPPQHRRLRTAVSSEHPSCPPWGPSHTCPHAHGMSPKGHRSRHLGFKECFLIPYT